MTHALLALGSNLGDRAAVLSAAVAAIGNLSRTRVLKHSDWHATRPIGGPGGQGEFLNGAALLETELPPGELKSELQGIERHLGRERAERWAARTVDIDLLLYGERVIDEPELEIPHPRMSFRPFVLAPAAEIAAEMIHPVLGASVGALWRHVQHARDVLAVCGGSAAERHSLAEQLRQRGLPLSELPDAVPQADCLFQQVAGSENISSGAIDDSAPKLVINLSGTWADLPKPLRGLPTLAIEGADQQRLIEAAAAIEAVWPDLCRAAP